MIALAPVELTLKDMGKISKYRIKTNATNHENKTIILGIFSSGRWYDIEDLISWIGDIDGLVQERCNSSASAMELRLSCTNPLI